MTRQQNPTWAGRVPALHAMPATGRGQGQTTTAIATQNPASLRARLALIGALMLVALGLSPRAHAESPNYVVQGPTIVQTSCSGLCDSISYPADSPIAKDRIVVVPRGNLQFNFPVSSSIPATGTDFHVGFQVVVTVEGPKGQTVTNSASTTFTGPGSSTLAVPINVDWAESIVTIQINLTKSYIESVCNGRLGCKLFNYDYTAGATGPSLASVPLGLTFPGTLADDAFLVVNTPAAAFQLPVLPVAILYAPVGNENDAKSTLAFTSATGTTQELTTSQGTTYGNTQDDRTMYQGNVNLSFNGVSNLGTVSVGFDFSSSWDNSVESDVESQSTSTSEVTQQEIEGIEFTNAPAPGQPPLNEITSNTQPFWDDELIVVANAQYAVWDYPGDPVVQPLGNAGVIELPIRALDGCVNTPTAIEPNSSSPSVWEPGASLPVGTFVLSHNSYGDIDGQQVVTTAGTSGAAQPSWATLNGNTTVDGTVIWTNESYHLLPKPEAVGQTVPSYVWLDSPGCLAIASLDQFYVQKSQAAYPPFYDLLASLTVNTGNPNEWTNTQESTDVVTQSVMQQLTTKTSSQGSNTAGISGSLSSLLGLFGINLSGSSTSTVTNTFTGISSSTAQSGRSYAGTAAESTTIHDSYAEELPVNVIQDLIFGGIAVSVPSFQAPQPIGPRLPILRFDDKAGEVPSMSPQSKPAQYKAVKPARELDAETLAAARQAAASQHTDREVPQPEPGFVIADNPR